jgi:hypothetical protein
MLLECDFVKERKPDGTPGPGRRRGELPARLGVGKFGAYSASVILASKPVAS